MENIVVISKNQTFLKTMKQLLKRDRLKFVVAKSTDVISLAEISKSDHLCLTISDKLQKFQIEITNISQLIINDDIAQKLYKDGNWFLPSSTYIDNITNLIEYIVAESKTGNNF